MLEILADAGPMAIPLWAVLAFSAAMYPIGLMLGAPCSPCCGCPNGETRCGTDCCTQEQTCCNGKCCDNVCCEGVCCPPGTACIDGVCVGPCFCPDPCMFMVTVVEPLAYGPQPVVACDPSDFSGGASTQEAIAAACLGPTNDVLSPESLNLGQNSLNVSVQTVKEIFADRDQPDGHKLLITGRAFANMELVSPDLSSMVLVEGTLGASLKCLTLDPDSGEPFESPRLFVFADYRAAATYFRNGANLGFYLIQKLGHYEVSDVCGVQSGATCFWTPFNKNSVRLPAPIEFTISSDSAGLGDWLTNYVVASPPFPEPAEPCATEMANVFSATFRITQRQRCVTVECGCGVSVCQLVAAVRAYPGGPLVEWILCRPDEEQPRDKEFTCTVSGVSYTCLYKYRQLTETKNGAVVSVHRFIYERYANPPDVSGFPRERKVADLWCDSEGWFMDFHTVCYRVDLVTGFPGGFEEDRSVGEMLCGPACGNDGSGRAPDDPIPLGFASNVIGVPGFPYSEGELSCDIGLGERLSVEIRETLTC